MSIRLYKWHQVAFSSADCTMRGPEGHLALRSRLTARLERQKHVQGLRPATSLKKNPQLRFCHATYEASACLHIKMQLSVLSSKNIKGKKRGGCNAIIAQKRSKPPSFIQIRMLVYLFLHHSFI